MIWEPAGRVRMRVALTALAIVMAACGFDDQLVPCGELACPIGRVCTASGCATPESAASCNGIADGEPCTTQTIAVGTCTGGACFVAACGNDTVDRGEVCDDGNNADSDGCSADCRSNETCGNAAVDPREACDEGVAGLSSDGCTSTCEDEFELWRDVSPRGLTARASFGFAFDSDRGVGVLYGGNNGTFTAETWEWDGTNWRRLVTPIAPSPRTEIQMAYHATRKRTVLFGGETIFFIRLGDTWEWDGVTWVARTPAQSPSVRSRYALAYHPGLDLTFLFGGSFATNGLLGDTWVWNGLTWSQVGQTGPQPSAREHAMMTFDRLSGKLVLFGGSSSNGVKLNDTWTWDDTMSKWAPLAPVGKPPARAGGAIASDSVGVVLVGGQSASAPLDDVWRWFAGTWTSVGIGASPRAHARMVCDDNRFILFGGMGSSLLGDTWELANSTWTPLDVQIAPSARADHGMAYDSRRGRVVLFGGQQGTGLLGDTWEWDGANWLLATSVSMPGPEARSAHGLAYDEQRGVTLMFGGRNPTLTDELWQWNGVDWSMISKVGALAWPAAREAMAMSYDRERGRLVVFGGGGAGGSELSDTWEWDGSSWKEMLPMAGPSGRRAATMAYDPVRKRSVLVGGIDSAGALLADIWEWDGASWTEVGTLGSSLLPRSRTGLAFDSLRGRVVGFGGTTVFGGGSDETFEWSGALDVRGPALVPSVRGGAPLAYDAIEHTTVMFGGADGSQLRGDTWVRQFQAAMHPAEACVQQGDDTDGDGLAGCADPDCFGRCAPLCLPGTTCDLAPRCPDGACSPVEDHLICPDDCESPPP